MSGVKPELKSLTVHEDERGALFEVIHDYDMPKHRQYLPIAEMEAQGFKCATPILNAPAQFGQVYVVRSPARGTVRAFHRHRHLVDYFCCVRGRAKVLVIKTPGPLIPTARLKELADAGHELAVDFAETYILTAEQPRLLTIPAGLWHGWEALDDETTLLCIGTEVYNRDDPDEERVPAEWFGDAWGIRGR